MKSFLAILLFASCGSYCLAATAPSAAPKLRLDEVQEVQPVKYRIDLRLDPTKTDFSGSIAIQIDVRKPTSTIWLNQEKIKVSKASLRRQGKELTAHVHPGGDDFVGLAFDDVVPAGPAELNIEYAGVVNEKNSAAIFRQEDNGNWYAFTQFEPTDARGAFPCFDEPSYKTPWQLTLRTPEGDSAVSNTPVASSKTEGGSKVWVFEETKPLPSYLVAFGVGPFEYVDGGKAGKKKAPVRIVVPKGHREEAKYAAEVTATILTRLEDYFGIAFPYPKSDQVAIPATIGFGAMENPGMVTYSQTILLAKPAEDTIQRQRGYASVAAHELAHQWFGDLVTTAWWNDIWLNEAFATWMEQKLIAEWKPEWNTRTGDVDGKLGAAADDSLISARKIRQEIETKDDINNAFDSITYVKGAAVIGMFESWVGPEEFRKGVQSYMKQYAWRATTAGDFLDSISSASHKDVTKSFSTFLNQAGIPVVSMALDCSQGTPKLHLEQKRFLPTGSKGSADQTWRIPVCVRYADGGAAQSECTLMTDASMDWTLKGAKSCPAWVEANDEAKGYYRADYHGDLLPKLVEGRVTERLNAAERVELIGNAKALAWAGTMSGADALKLVDAFHADPERHVVETALDLATAPRLHMVPEDLFPKYQEFLRKNFDARARELGWTVKPGEPEEVRLLRPTIVQTMATWGGDEELAQQGRDLGGKWLDDHSSVDPNLVNAALETAAFYGDKALFERFVSEFKKTKDLQTRQKLVNAMNSFRDPASIETAYKAVLSGEVPFLQAARLFFAGIGYKETQKMPFEFLKANYDEFVSKMPTGGGFDFGSVLPRLGETFCDAKSRDELNDFFAPRVDKFVGASRTLKQTLEEIDLCIALKQAQQPSVIEFLKGQ